jgi:tRNA dimethylallyltransferase
LLALGLCGELPVMRALGVAPIAAHLAGATSLEAAAAAAKAETRQYAKRQLTWLRRNMIAWTRLDTQQMERFNIDIFSFNEP